MSLGCYDFFLLARKLALYSMLVVFPPSKRCSGSHWIRSLATDGRCASLDSAGSFEWRVHKSWFSASKCWQSHTFAQTCWCWMGFFFQPVDLGVHFLAWGTMTTFRKEIGVELALHLLYDSMSLTVVYRSFACSICDLWSRSTIP